MKFKIRIPDDEQTWTELLFKVIIAVFIVSLLGSFFN
jgi:hypothetical protein